MAGADEQISGAAKGDAVKRALGVQAADEFVRSGMRIGLGTGSTAIWAIRRIAEGLAAGRLRDIVGVPSSTQSLLTAREGNIPLRSMNDPDIDGVLDLVIDGADEVDGGGRLTKGGGAALVKEKILAYNAKRVVIIAGASKVVSRLGRSYPIPVEVIPEAQVPAERALRKLGGWPELREALRKMGPVITDNGNILLDTYFDAGIEDPVAMEAALNGIPGVLGNGIFAGIEAIVLLGEEDGGIRRLS